MTFNLTSMRDDNWNALVEVSNLTCSLQVTWTIAGNFVSIFIKWNRLQWILSDDDEDDDDDDDGGGDDVDDDDDDDDFDDDKRR